MIYIDPQNVTSPKDFVEEVQVLYNDGPEGVSMARIIWEGKECLGIRWNIARREWDENEKINDKKQCVGMPSSRGYPVWFILPDNFFDKNSSLFKNIQDKLK